MQHSTPSSSARFIAALLAATLLTTSAALFADNTTWTGAAVGNNDFGDADNWSNGAPGAIDNAYFDSAGTTEVDFSAAHTVASVNFTPDAGGLLRTVQLNLSGFSLSGSFAPSALGRQTLIFDDGTFNISNAVALGSGDVTRPALIRLQNGVVFNFSTSSITLGNSGSFAVEVLSGSEIVNTGRMTIGTGVSTVASMTISGVGSRVENQNVGNATGNNIVGSSGGTGELIVENGGWFSGGRRIYIGTGGNGSLIVRGSELDENNNVVYSTVVTAGDHSGLVLRGDRDGDFGSGSAYALFKDGGRGIFAHGMAMFDNSVLEIDRGYVQVTQGTLSPVGAQSRYFADGSELIYWLYSGEHDQRIDIAGSFEIAGATLTIELGDDFTATLGEEFYLIKRPANFTGAFADLTEGDMFSVGDYTFQISYAMGASGNLIGLTVVPEPATAAIFAALAAIALAVSRTHRQRN